MSSGKSRKRRKGPRLTQRRVLGALAAFVTVASAVQYGAAFVEWVAKLLT
jgi:hypothetical protein